MFPFVHGASSFGFEISYFFAVDLIKRTHNDPLLSVFDNPEIVGKDFMYGLQVLHLVARPSYHYILGPLMARFLANEIADPLYLLAMDPTKDLIGHLDTPRSFNEDNDRARRLFHKTHVHPKLFAWVFFELLKTRPSAVVNTKDYKKIKRMYKNHRFEEIRTFALQLIRVHHTFWKFSRFIASPINDVFDVTGAIKQKAHMATEKKTGKRKESPMEEQEQAACNLINKFNKQQLKRQCLMITRAVAALQSEQALGALYTRTEELWKSRRLQAKLLHEYMLGPIFDIDASSAMDHLKTALLPTGLKI